ncbi:spore germination protein GerW family protein [Nocardiopsis coralliicola]
MPKSSTGDAARVANRRTRAPALAAAAGMLQRAAETARSERVFGDPVRTRDLTVVPVSRVRFAATFGGGSSRIPALGDGAGGAAGGAAEPCGFLVLRGTDAEYRPIRRPAAALAVPLALIAAATAVRIVGVSVRAARRRARDRAAAACAQCSPAPEPAAAGTPAEGQGR